MVNTSNRAPLTLHHFFESGMHNIVLFTGTTKLGTPSGVWCGYTPPTLDAPGVIQMLYSTRESRGHVGSILGVTARHSLKTYGGLPEGSHDLSCHSFPVQQRLAFTLGQIPAERTANSEDWICAVRYMKAWHQELMAGTGEPIDITELQEGKNYLLEILNSEGADIPIPDWAVARNREYAPRRLANGRELDRLENFDSASPFTGSLV
jgi:hypothetical protein